MTMTPTETSWDWTCTDPDTHALSLLTCTEGQDVAVYIRFWDVLQGRDGAL